MVSQAGAASSPAGVTRIIGVGNSLRGDDGIGPALVERLARQVWPAGVEVVDGGSGGWSLLHLMEGAERVILVDGAELGRPPGSVVRLAGEQLVATLPAGEPSLHERNLATVLALGYELALLPEVTLVLVQVGPVRPGAGLSPPLARALEPLALELRQQVLADR